MNNKHDLDELLRQWDQSRSAGGSALDQLQRRITAAIGEDKLPAASDLSAYSTPAGALASFLSPSSSGPSPLTSSTKSDIT